jgi:hypothetical protein
VQHKIPPATRGYHIVYLKVQVFFQHKETPFSLTCNGNTDCLSQKKETENSVQALHWSKKNPRFKNFK